MNEAFGVGLWQPLLGSVLLALLLWGLRSLNPGLARARSIKRIDAQRRTVRIATRALKDRRAELKELSLPELVVRLLPSEADDELTKREIDDSRRRYLTLRPSLNEEGIKLSLGSHQKIIGVFALARNRVAARRALAASRSQHASRFARDDLDNLVYGCAATFGGLLLLVYLLPGLAVIGTSLHWWSIDVSPKALAEQPSWYVTALGAALAFGVIAAIAGAAVGAGTATRSRLAGATSRAKAMLIPLAVGFGAAAVAAVAATSAMAGMLSLSLSSLA